MAHLTATWPGSQLPRFESLKSPVMSWTTMVGHEGPIRRLRAALGGGRLRSALLFEGPEGIGKRLVALPLARAVHCPRAPERGGDPCGECRACLAIAASADPEK